MRGDNDGLGDLMKGMLAGIAATWVMGKVTSHLYEHEDPAAREREDDARNGRSAYAVAAEKGAALVGRDLSDEQLARAGSAIHWSIGATAGAFYGAVRGRVPGADSGAGLVYGTVFFLLMDEGANVALGLTPGPRAFPWQAHARGFVGHLTFGLATELSMRVLDRIER